MKYSRIKTYFLSIICFSIGYGVWCYFEMILWGVFWDIFRLRFGVIVMSAIWGLIQGVVLGIILIFIEKNWRTTFFRDVPTYGMIGGIFFGIAFAYIWNNRISTNKSNRKF